MAKQKQPSPEPAQLVEVSLPRPFGYRLPGESTATQYSPGRQTVPARFAGNLIKGGALTLADFPGGPEDYARAAQAAGIETRPAPAPEEPPTATPAPAGGPVGQEDARRPEPTPLDDDTPGYSALIAARIYTEEELAERIAAGTLTEIKGIGPATAAAIEESRHA